MKPSSPEPGKSTVELSFDDDLAFITLARPERLNAVSPQLVADLLIALHSIGSSAARAVIFSGKGKAFCAGHDLKEPPATGDSRVRLEQLQEVTRKIRGLPQPVIAAVHGHAIGAGAEFALGCDLILAADDTTFSFPEVGLGLSVTGAASQLLPHLVGLPKAKELVWFGIRLNAADAARLGLVNRVVPAADLIVRAEEWARTLAGKPPIAVAMAKRAMNHGIENTMDSALELEVSHALITDESPDARATAAKFKARK